MRQISEAINKQADHGPQRVAIHLDGRVIRYGALPGLVHACAAELAQKLPAPSDTQPVALVGGSTPELVIHLFALWQLGYGVLPQSDRLPEAERKRVADQAGAMAWVAADQDNVASSDTSSSDTSERKPIAMGGWLTLPSSGTTGQPKIVRRDSEAVDAVAFQVEQSVGYRSDDIVFAAVPLTHAYGLEAGLLAPLLAGSRIELENLFSPGALGQRLTQTGATIFPSVPAMIDMLVHMHTGDDKTPFPGLRKLLCAGAPLPAQLWQQCADTLGHKPANYYGATEMGSVCLADPDEPGHDAGWLGRPMPGVSMRIVDLNTRQPVAAGVTGEIAVHAPSLMTGYLDAEGSLESHDAFTVIDGKPYFLTGDLGTCAPDGHFRFIARQKLLIEVGANKVNPMEVEAILRMHPGVREALVTGEQLNQTVCRLNAAVEPCDEEQPPTAAELRAHCRHHLAAWKIPRSFRMQPLARTALGKVIRAKQEVST